MHLFDTNVLIYMSINQGEKKQNMSQSLIRDAIAKKVFFITPFILSEYIYTLAKLNILSEQRNKVELFSRYVSGNIDKKIIVKAYELCQEINFCRNINDVIHLKVAEQYGTKLVTFDSDFKKLQKYTDIEIEVIQ